MEMYQSGYYIEDFRTQEVPAGFDFGSYGKEMILIDIYFNISATTAICALPACIHSFNTAYRSGGGGGGEFLMPPFLL